MVKFEIEICTSSWTCISVDETSSSLLGAHVGSPLAPLLADALEMQDLKLQVEALEQSPQHSDAFATLNLVFRAPGASDSSSIDRSPLKGVFRSPIRAIHMSQEQELCCLVHIQRSPSTGSNPNASTGTRLLLTAIELSREYRSKMLGQEFGSWLLEDHIEKSVIATDPLGTVVFWNRFAAELYQFTQEEAMGKNIMELTPAEMTQEQGVEIFTKLLKGEHWKGFFQVQRKDKSKFMAHVTDTPVMHDEQLKFVVGISADYTPMHDLMEEQATLNATLEDQVQKRTQALLDSERSLRMVGAAVEQSDTGVLIADEHCKIVWSNQAAHNLLQLSSEQIQHVLPWNLPLDFQPLDDEETITFQDFFQTNQNKNQQRTLEALVAKSRTSKNDQQQQGSDDDEDDNDDNSHGSGSTNSSRYRDQVCLSISVQPMTDCKNRMIILRDLTTEKEANDAHRRAEQEAAASRTKTEMIQMLSHEFRTPLQGIMGVVSTHLLDMKEEDMQDSGDSDNEQGRLLYESLSTIAASSRLLLTLINNVLDMAKMDAQKMNSIDLSSTSLHNSIQDAVTFCEPFARMNEVQLHLEQVANIKDTMVMANKLRLEQVIINLLSNAVKYSGAGKQVHIGVRMASNRDVLREAFQAGASDVKLMSPPSSSEQESDDDAPVAIVTIRDQGRGIPEEEMGCLFGEFNQLIISKEKDNSDDNSGNSHNRKRKAHAIGQSSGSGLGLCLVLKFVSMMNGHVWVTNADAGGAEFHFSFPVADSPAPVPAGEKDTLILSPTAPLSSAPSFDSEKSAHLRVLLLDDSLINLKVLKRMLGRLGVHHVQIFTDGAKAITSLRQTKSACFLPSLIMTDLQMPTMSGFDFLCQLKEMSVYQKRPTVIACSADWTAETEQRCLRAGFDGFLRKPIVLSALREFLKTQMQQQSPLEVPREIAAIETDFSVTIQPPSKIDIPADDSGERSSKMTLHRALVNVIEPDDPASVFSDPNPSVNASA